MEKRINKKKIVSRCPSRVSRSVCPSIKKTRRIRRDLFRLQRDPSITEKTINKLRLRLKQKKNQGISDQQLITNWIINKFRGQRESE